MSAVGPKPPSSSHQAPDAPVAEHDVGDDAGIHWVELAPLFLRDAIGAASVESAAPEPAPVVSSARRYVLCEQLAEGGMGAVYLGRQIGDGGFEREVVLKRLRSELAVRKDLLSLFLAEARLLSSLSHPGIVRSLDLLKLEGAYYLVMEYVRGGDLRRLLQRARRRGRKLSAQAALYIGRELLSALDYAHHRERAFGERRRLIIHGDISPSNILLSEHGEVKLTDFGITRAGDTASVLRALPLPGTSPESAAPDEPSPAERLGERTGEGTTNPRLRTRGKVGYMSPEQARGEALDARSDLFSLAVVLYELLTDQRLYIGAPSASPALVFGTAVEPPSRKCPELPPAFDAVLLRALSLRREDRYPTARLFYQELLALSHQHGLLMERAELAEHLREVCGGEVRQWTVLEERTGTARIDLDDPLDLGSEANLTVVAPRPLSEPVEVSSDFADLDEATSPRARRTGELRIVPLPLLSQDSGEEISEAGITVPFPTVPHTKPRAEAPPPRVGDDTQPLPPISNHTQPLPTHPLEKAAPPEQPLPAFEEPDESIDDEDSDSGFTTARHLSLSSADAAARKRELVKRHRRRLVDVLWGVLWGVLVGAILFSLISSGRC